MGEEGEAEIIDRNDAKEESDDRVEEAREEERIGQK